MCVNYQVSKKHIKPSIIFVEWNIQTHFSTMEKDL